MYYSGRLAFTFLWSHLVPILISQVHNAELPPPMHQPGNGAIFIHPMYVPLPFRKNKNRPTSFIIKFTRNTSHLVLARTFCQSWLGSDVRAMSLSRVRVNSFYSFFILSHQKTKEPYSSQFLALSLLLVLALVTLYLGTRIPAQLPGQINGWITAKPFIIIAEEDFNQIECHECL